MFTHNLIVRHLNGEYEGFSGCGSTAEAAERNAKAKATRDIGEKRLDPSKVSYLTADEFARLDDETKATIRSDWRLSGRSAAASGIKTNHAALNPARHAELLAKAKPQLDIRREPTGWMFVDFDNGRILIHPAEPKAIQFADAGSGTGLLRARALAQTYAVDHPITKSAALAARRPREPYSAIAEETLLADSDAINQIAGLLGTRPWNRTTARQVAELLRETGREIEEPEGELDEGEPDDEWVPEASAYSRISSRIAVSGVRYKSDADIADEFAGFTIESIEVNPKRHEGQDWLSGSVVIHFPNAGEHVAGGMEGPATVTDHFMVYDASDVAGSQIGWDNWYPAEASKSLEEAVRARLLAAPAARGAARTGVVKIKAAQKITEIKAVRYNMSSSAFAGEMRPPEWRLRYMHGDKPCSIPLPNTNPDLWRPPLGKDMIKALKNLGIQETPGMLDSVEIVW